MGVQKKTRKFAQVKRAISQRDNRLYVWTFAIRFTARLFVADPSSRKESQKPDNNGKGKKDDVVREA